MTTPVALPSDLWRRVDQKVLYKPFLQLAELAIANAAARGALFYPISGLRTWEDQAALFAQGRTKPGKIVTKARPGQSAHNYAVAIDACRDADTDRAGLQMDWNLEDYRILAEEAVKVGLEAAFNWTTFKEGPHIQLPLHRVDLTFDKLTAIYTRGGMKAVVAELDRYRW